jgi:hypothetical protein
MKYMAIVHTKNQIFTLNFAELLFKNRSGNVGIKLFNKLPDTIKSLEKIQEFKRRLKYFLLQHVFYSVDEYMSHYYSAVFYYYVHFLLSINILPNRILEKSYSNVCAPILCYIIVLHKLM